MQPRYVDGNVRAHCPDCGGAVTTFECRSATGGEYGSVTVSARHLYQNVAYLRVSYVLLRCASCGRGGLATIHNNSGPPDGILGDFSPVSLEVAPLPRNVPENVLREFREAELCLAHKAFRAASALFRSTLEKALRANGYRDGVLAQKIDDAASDGIITAARRQLAHDNVRVLGNDVLHDDWREVTPEEVEESHRYSQRVLEDFYDDRVTVEGILRARNRLGPNPIPARPNP